MQTKPEANLPALQLGTIGDRIRYKRRECGLSQTDLAKQASVTQPVISELEANKTRTSGRTPSIAAALGVSAYWLETGISESNSQVHDGFDDDVLTIPVMVAPGNCGGRGKR